MATPNPKFIFRPGWQPAPDGPHLAQMRRDIERARAQGAEAAFRGEGLDANPFHPATERSLCRHWDEMFLKTYRAMRTGQIA